MNDKTTFNTSLGGVATTIHYSSFNTIYNKTSFSYLRKDIQFNIDNISTNKFFQCFREVHTNIDMFGSNAIGYYNPNAKFCDQIENIRIKFMKDIFKYFDILLHIHQKQLRNYCTWYRNSNNEPDTYQTYVQLVTCNSIINSNFEGNNAIVPREIVPFTI
jgi:hypothetical protein